MQFFTAVKSVDAIGSNLSLILMTVWWI